MRLCIRWCLLGLLILSATGLSLTTICADEPAASRLTDWLIPIPPFDRKTLWEGRKCSNPDERLPPELADELKEAFRELAIDATVKLDGRTLTAEFQCRKFQVYSRDMGGTLSPTSRPMLGPLDRGCLLTLEYAEQQYSGQAGPAGSFNGTFNHERPTDYWKQRAVEFTLPEDRGYLFMRYSYGNRTDPNLLPRIAAAIGKVYGLAPRETSGFSPDDTRSRADVILTKLEGPLRELVEKRCPKAQVSLENQTLVVSYQVQDFNIHAVTQDGQIAATSHVEKGPMDDGFLIKIFSERRIGALGEVPLYGKSKKPYWTQVWNSFSARRANQYPPPPDDSVRFEIHYGHRSDKQLFRDLEKLMSDYGTLAIRGQFAD